MKDVNWDYLNSLVDGTILEEEPEIEKKARIRLYKEMKLVDDRYDSTILFDIKNNRYAMAHMLNGNLSVIANASNEPIKHLLEEIEKVSCGEVTIVYARKYLQKIAPPTQFAAIFDKFDFAVANQSSPLLKKFNWKTDNPCYTIKERVTSKITNQLFKNKERYVEKTSHIRETTTIGERNRGQFNVYEVLAPTSH